jgi:hypothetical protein
MPATVGMLSIATATYWLRNRGVGRLQRLQRLRLCVSQPQSWSVATVALLDFATVKTKQQLVANLSK